MLMSDLKRGDKFNIVGHSVAYEYILLHVHPDLKVTDSTNTQREYVYADTGNWGLFASKIDQQVLPIK